MSHPVQRRHLFSDKQYVEEFRTEDVQRELGLDQMALIRLAMLLGSDYTEGAAGIGIVNAVEARGCRVHLQPSIPPNAAGLLCRQCADCDGVG